MPAGFRHSIGWTFFLVLLAGMASVGGLTLGLTYLGVGQSFARYVRAIELSRTDSLAETLTTAYAQEGGWDFLPRPEPAFRDWLRRALHPGDGGDRPPPRRPPPPRPQPPPYGRGWPPPPPPQDAPAWQPRPPPDRLDLIGRVALLDPQGRLLAGTPGGASAEAARRPLLLDGGVIGYLALAPAGLPTSGLEERFLADQKRNALLISLFALCLSALFGLRMAKHLQKPIAALSRATEAMAGGAFDTRLDEGRKDELGDLARAFNRLGESLSAYERSRRQWVADTSHELRTPLAVLRAQIEALQDGVHAADPERLAILHGEVMALTALVDDLYLLARADVGVMRIEMVPLEPLSILEEVLDAAAPRLAAAGLALQRNFSVDPPWASLGDAKRLRQMFLNLIENSIRYTDRGGQVAISARPGESSLIIRIEDSLPGVSPAELPRLFDRFYRQEASRSRESGGAGLGLSICRTIIEAHGGTIAAQPSALGGLLIEILLPRKHEEER